MTLDEFKETLLGIEPGKFAAIHYDLYSDLFPPGEPDQTAREVCFNFARSAGCRIENKPDLEEVWFVKDAHRP